MKLSNPYGLHESFIGQSRSMLIIFGSSVFYFYFYFIYNYLLLLLLLLLLSINFLLEEKINFGRPTWSMIVNVTEAEHTNGRTGDEDIANSSTMSSWIVEK